MMSDTMTASFSVRTQQEILVRKIGSSWIFDDESRGIKNEPFVLGSSEIIDMLLKRMNRPRVKSVLLIFSDSDFRESTFALENTGEAIDGGRWYIETLSKMKGWLCPTTLCYFDHFPQTIYGRILA